MFHFKKKKPRFLCPASGKIMDLSQVPDPVFSQKLMGDGFAIELSSGEVIAPFDGEIVTAFPTGHAYGIRSQDGLEVLLHIGLDTVELNGDGFHPQVCVNQQVKQGDVLVRIDMNSIQQHGKSLISPIIFTSKEIIKVIATTSQVEAFDDVIQIK